MCKTILQTCMNSMVGRGLNFVSVFFYITISCVQAQNALVRLHICEGSSEPSLLTNAVSRFNLMCWPKHCHGDIGTRGKG